LGVSAARFAAVSSPDEQQHPVQHVEEDPGPAVRRRRGVERLDEVRGASFTMTLMNLSATPVKRNGKIIVMQGQDAAPSTTVHAEPLRAILAARLSNKKSGASGGQGINIETQDKEANAWAKRQREIRTFYGIYPGIEIIEVVADIKSGRVAPWHRKNLKPWVTRPDLMQRYDAVIAHKNDRLSRGDPEDEMEIRQWARSNGKALIIVDGPQSPARDDGDLWSWTAMAKQAASEWREIRERTGRAQGELRQRGKVASGAAPWGYMIAGKLYHKTLVPTEQGRIWVPQIFQRIADGHTLQMVADWLNEHSVPAARSPKWHRHAAMRLIGNRVYAGMRTTKAGDPLFEVEALVPADLWLKANERLRTAPVSRRGPAKHEPALLTGALFCDLCPRDGQYATMYRIMSEKGRYRYYRCNGHKPDHRGCGNVVYLGLTDQAALAILSLSQAPWTELQLIKGVNNDAELAKVKLAIRDLAAEDLPDEEYDRHLAGLRARRDELAALPNVPDRWEEVPTSQTVGQHFMSLDPADQRRMIINEVKFFAQPARLPGKGMRGAPILRMESRLFTLPRVHWAEPKGEAD
jgi:DNA invertase Pin-like site-specific DNA recombinase